MTEQELVTEIKRLLAEELQLIERYGRALRGQPERRKS